VKPPDGQVSSVLVLPGPSSTGHVVGGAVGIDGRSARIVGFERRRLPTDEELRDGVAVVNRAERRARASMRRKRP